MSTRCTKGTMLWEHCPIQSLKQLCKTMYMEIYGIKLYAVTNCVYNNNKFMQLFVVNAKVGRLDFYLLLWYCSSFTLESVLVCHQIDSIPHNMSQHMQHGTNISRTHKNLYKCVPVTESIHSKEIALVPRDTYVYCKEIHSLH